MGWDSFIWFALTASTLWTAGAAVSVRSGSRLAAATLTSLGSGIFLTFIAGVWVTLGRPPLRTMGETRLWFSLFLSLTGLVIYLRWRHRWALPFASLMAVVFVCINIFKPEIHTQELMPALRSPWFVPHVIVYMFAYAVLGLATILAVRLLWLSRPSARQNCAPGVPVVSGTISGDVSGDAYGDASGNGSGTIPADVSADVSCDPDVRGGSASPARSLPDDLGLCDSLVRLGWGFLTMGMVMGALWAKQAWGDYWTWDPKETWAAATWLSYLLYLHLRQRPERHSEGQSVPRPGRPVSGTARTLDRNQRRTLLLLIFSFAFLQMCWWGVNLLPSAQGFSLHTY
jgi:ABC-type transport system involved in cytochrome c biogenesis permease subunit